MTGSSSYWTLCAAAAALTLIMIAGAAEAATNVGASTITSDTTWTQAGSPYNVTGAVRIRNDATLTVEAGVTVNLQNGQRIYVGDPNAVAGTRVGHLVLDGTGASPVTVTGSPLQFDGWNGAAGASTLRNVTFTGTAGWAIEAYTFSLLTILDSSFLSPASGGVYLSASSPTIAGTTFTGGPYGVYSTDWSSAPTLVGNAFSGQTTRYARLGVTSFLAGNTFTGAGSRVQLFGGSRWWDSDVTIRAQPVTYELNQWIGIRNSATLTFEAGVTAVGADDFYATMGDAGSGTPSLRPGRLMVLGTEAAPVVLSSLSGSATNGWDGFHFYGYNGAARDSLVQNATLRQVASYTFYVNTWNNLTLDRVTVENGTSYGMYLDSASPTIRASTFRGASYGVYSPNWVGRPTILDSTFVDQTTRYAQVGVQSYLDGNAFTGTGTAVNLVNGGVWYDSDVTIRREDVTYHLHNWMGVRNGAKLTIEAGVNALGASDFYATIGDAGSGTPSLRPASLEVLGTATEPVVLGSISGSAVSGWQGFHLYGYNGAARESVVRNATIRHTTSYGFYVNTWNNLTLDRVTVLNGTSYGMYLDSASPTIRDSTFRGASYGVYSPNWVGRPTILGSHFVDQTTRHAQVGVQSYLDGNTFAGTGTAVNLVNGGIWYDSSVTIRHEPVTYYLHNWMGIRNGATLTIEAGVTALGASDFYATIGDAGSGTPSLRPGALRLLGTAAEPIVIGSISGSPTSGWHGFHMYGYNGAARPSVIQNATLRHTQTYGMYVNTWDALTVADSRIESVGNYGLYLDSSSPRVLSTAFVGSPYGVYSPNWVGRPTILDSTFHDQTTRHARVGLTSLLEGNTFTGTGTAVELLAGNRWIDETDVTIRNEGVRYDLHNWFGQRYDHTFTIEPGIDIRAANDVTIYIGEPGTQATAGVRANVGVYSYTNAAFAFRPGSSGSGCNINGPDLLGYVCESIPYAFSNISTTGTQLPICDNCVSGAVPLGFDFTFYGNTYANAYLADNGFLTFSPGQSGGCCSAQSIPAYGSPDNLVAGYWDDLRLLQGGSVKYQTVGAAPDRAFIAQWTNVPHCCDNNNVVTFQIVLREGSNVAEVHLERAPARNSNHVTGVESPPLAHYPRGRVVAEGTVAEPISIGSLSGSPTSGWNGFRFQGWNGAQTADTVLRNVTLRQAQSYNAQFSTWSVGTFDNLTIGPAGTWGLYLESSSPSFMNAVLNGSLGHNAYLSSSSPTFHGGVSERAAGYGIYTATNWASPRLLGMTFRDNVQRPLRIPLHASIEGSTFERNGIQEIEYLATDYTTSQTFRPYYDAASGARLTSVLVQSFTLYNTATLTIEPDTRLLVENAISINIGSCCTNPTSRGNLTAEGTKAQPIYVGSRSGSATNGWYGFYFRGDFGGGTAILRNATVAFSRDANIETYAYHGLTLDNVTLDRSAQQGMIIQSSNPTFRNVDVTRPGWEAMYFSSSNPTWRGGTMDHTGRSGFYASGCGIATLVDVVIDTPNGYGFYADGSCNGAHFDGVTFLDTVGRPWRNRLDVRYDVTIANGTVKEVEYWGNDLTSDRTLTHYIDTQDAARFTSVILSSFTVWNQATWTILPNTTVLVEPWTSISIGSCCSNPSSRGNLSAEGTEAQPIVFKARAGTANPGWYGFYFRGDYAAGTSVLRNTTIAFSRDEGIETYVYHGLTLDNVTMDRNAGHGLYFHSSNPTLRNVVSNASGAQGAYFYYSNPTWSGGGVTGAGASGIYTSGCGVATLRGIELTRAGSYGLYADGNCNGAHLDGVAISNVGNRPWRNRLDVRYDVTIANATVKEAEYWGNDITSDRTLTHYLDARDGVRFTSVILSSFTVRNQATWTVLPNTTVLVEPWTSISIGSCCSNPSSRGNLSAEGTEAQPIEFRARAGTSNPGWYGFYFRGDYAPGTSVLRNTTIALSRDEGIETYVYHGLTLDNVTFDRNAGHGFYFHSSNPTLRNVVSNASGVHGAYLYYSNPTWAGGGVVRPGASGLYTAGCGVATLVDVVIERPTGYGVFADGNCNGAHLDGVTFRDVGNRPWRNRLDVRTTDVTIVNSTLNEVEYWGNDITASRTLQAHYDTLDGARHTSVLLGSFTVHNAATWTIGPDVRLLVENGQWFNVGSCCSNPSSRGNLTVLGTAEQPVHIGSRSGSVTNGWYGMYFRGDYAGGTSVLRNVTIAFSRDDGIETYAYSGLTLDNATLDRNARWGLYSYASSPTLAGTRVTGSGGHGIFAQGGGTVTLRDGIVENSKGNGYFSNDASTGATILGTAFQNNTVRPWKVRITDTVTDPVLRNNTIQQADYHGVDMTSNRTLQPFYDADTGARYDSVLSSAFTVHNQATWTILPDVNLRVENGQWVNVGSCCSNPSSRGQLAIQGTAERPVTATSYTGSSSTGWYGFYFRGDYAGGSSLLQNVTISLSRDEGIETYYYPGLTLDNVTLDRNARWGIDVHGTGATLRNVVSNGSGQHGARFYNSGPTWTGGGVTGSASTGIVMNGCGVATLRDVTISRATGYGFYADGTCNGAHMERVHFDAPTGRPFRNRLDASMTNVTATSPGIAEVELWGMTISGARTLTLEPVTDATTGAPFPTVILGAFTVNGGAVLDLAPDLQLRFRANEYVHLGSGSTSRGTLTVRGTRERPVNISGTSAAVGAWGSASYGGVYLDWTGKNLLQNVTIDGANVDAVRLVNGNVLVLDNATLKRANGNGLVLLSAGSRAYVNDTNLSENTANGIYVDTSTTLDMARSNASRNGANGIELRGATGIVRSTYLTENGRSGLNATTTNPSLSMSESFLRRNTNYGVDLAGTTGSVITNNAFMENQQGQARATAWNKWNVTPTTGRNIAYGPFLGGNSWSDYPGEDTDADGLGDTLVPYVTGLGPGGDRHPVMGNLFADFTVAIPDVLSLPRELVLRDASRGGFSPTDQWVWDLGDGTQAVTQQVTHTYAQDGSYAVQLVVSNAHGQVSSITKTVHVDSVPPVTDLTVNGTLGLDGWHVSPVNVTLAAQDDRSGVNHTYFRLDGGNATVYTQRFSITSDGAHNVSYHSVDKNGNLEPVREVLLRVDRTLPVAGNVSLEGTLGLGGWYVTDVAATLNATDNVSGLARIEYALNATPDTNYTGPVPLVSDGTIHLRYRPVDRAGLVGLERNVTVRRDATAPQVTASLDGPLGGGGYYLGDVGVTLAAVDATSGLATLTYSLDGAPAQAANGTILVSGQGDHALNVTAIDAAGNVNDTLRLVLRVDVTTPVSEHHFDGTLGANGVYVSPTNVSFTGNDTGSGIDRFVYSLDGAPNATYQAPFAIAVDGQHRLVYRAVDVAGNAETIHEVVFVLDLEAPTTNLNVTATPGANGWWVSNATAELTVDDPESVESILYALDGGEELSYVTPFPIQGEGVHAVTFHAISIGGLVEENKSRQVRIDLAAPTLAATLNGTAGLDGWYVTPVTVTLAAADGTSGIATTLVGLDGAPLATYTGPVTVSSTGEHALAGRTVDVAGFATDLASTPFKLDLDDPVTTLALSPAAPDGANGWYVTSPLVTLSASDVGSGVASILVSVDGGPEAAITAPFGLGEGAHVLAVRAVDAAGRAEAVRNFTVNVDLTPPSLDEVVQGTAGNAGWFVSAVNVTLAPRDATSGVAQVRASVDGGPEQAVTGVLTLTTTRAHTVAWRATDQAGLAANETLTVKVDRSAPTTLPDVAPGANGFGWRKQPATVTLTATDQGGLGSGVASIQHAMDGAVLSTYAGPFTVGEGFHNLSFHGVDVAGLVNATQVQTVNVDLTAPSLSATLRAPDHPEGWYLSSVQVNLTAADALSGVRRLESWVDNGGVSSTTGRTVTLSVEGTHVLHVRAVDFADVVSPVVDVPYKLDLSAPVSSHTLQGTLGGSNRSVAWYRTPVNFTMTSTDSGAGVASKLVRLDGGTPTQYTDRIAFATEGSINLSYYAIDLVDRVEAARTIPAFGVDLKAPVVTPVIEGSLDPEDGIYKTVVNVSLEATDGLSGVAANALKVRVGGGSFSTYAGTLTFNASGDYAIEFFATDVAGNVAPTQRLEFSVFVDTLPPVTTLTPAPSGWFGAPVTVGLRASDAQSSVHALLLRVDGGSLQEVLGNATDLAFDAEGVHTVEYAAIDIAGNTELFRTATYNVDLTPPTLAVDVASTMGSNGWIVSPVTFTPTAADALSGVARVVARVDGVESTLPGALRLAQSGHHNVTLFAVDLAGLASDPFAWSGRLDLDAPRNTTTVVGPAGLGGWHSGNVSVLLTATDTVSGVDAVEYRFDNGTWARYPGVAFQFTEEGLHFLEVRVLDLAGNVALPPGETVGIDRTRPAIDTTLAGTMGRAGWFVSWVNSTTTVVDAPGTPGAMPSGVHNFTRRIDGGANESAALPSRYAFNASGVHELGGFALDLALNGARSNVTIPVDLDDPSLDLRFEGPAGLNGWFTGPTLVSVSSLDPTSGPALAQRIVDGAPADVLEPIQATGDGVHAYVLRAVDVAGRTSDERNVLVKIDGTPPEIVSVLEGPRGANGWFTGPTTLRLDASDIVSGLHEIRYTVNDGPELVYGGVLRFAESGRHVVNYTGYDIAGNLLSREVSVGLDMDAPEAALSVAGVPSASNWFRSGVNVTLNASDPTSGVANLQYTFDLNASWIEYTGPIAITAEGNHTLWYRAIDESGLPSVIYQHHILIDVTTPIVGVRLENTLYVEIDGHIYIDGDFCIEITGIDAISGVKDAVLRLTGALDAIIRIDLSVSLQCFEVPQSDEPWEIGVGFGACDFADWCGEGDMLLEGGGGGGGSGMVFLRPFPGAVNLQHVSVPVFRTAFQPGGTEYETGLKVNYTDPDDPSKEKHFDGVVHNPTPPGLAQKTIIAGTRVPVWIAAAGINPVVAEFFIDGQKVAVGNVSELVRYERFRAEGSATAQGVVEPTFERQNVTQKLFVFQLDTFNMTAGEHTLLAKGIDRKGKTATGALVVEVLSPAVGNVTASTLEDAISPTPLPGPLPGEVPRPVREEVPEDAAPPLPPEVRDRLFRAAVLGRIVLDLLDTLVIDNYAFVDETMLQFYEAYETTNAAVTQLAGQPDPVTIYDVTWRAEAPDRRELVPEEGGDE